MAKEFVPVRVQSMNGVNIELFQFEYDLTWMAFFMDAEDRFYARYGGREDEDAESYLSQPSLVRVMRQALKLHREGDVLAGRYESNGRPPRFPEDIPTMPGMLQRRENKCIHCHDVKVAQLRQLRSEGRFSRDLVRSYPRPSAIGLTVERHEQNKLAAVAAGSAAERAGLLPGDVMLAADGRRIITAADLSRVLELTPEEATLPLSIRRDGTVRTIKLSLAGDWKRVGDVSWRASVETAGPNLGFWATPLDAEQKRARGIGADALAQRVTFLFPGHPTPPRADLRLEDVVIVLDGRREAMTTRQMHAHCQMNHDYGDKLSVTILRGDEEIELTLELPAEPED